MHESTKHPQRGRRTVSIDRLQKIYGSGIPDSMPFHKKYVVRPQKKFSDRPLFQKGSPGAGRGPCKDRQKRGNRVQGGSPAKSIKTGCRAGSPARNAGLKSGEL